MTTDKLYEELVWKMWERRKKMTRICCIHSFLYGPSHEGKQEKLEKFNKILLGKVSVGRDQTMQIPRGKCPEFVLFFIWKDTRNERFSVFANRVRLSGERVREQRALKRRRRRKTRGEEEEEPGSYRAYGYGTEENELCIRNFRESKSQRDIWIQGSPLFSRGTINILTPFT